MLKKEERISNKADYEEIKKEGQRKDSSLLVLLWQEKKGRRFGTIISKRISKKAVERNKIRRRLMEAVRKNKEIFPNNFWGLFLVRKNILDKSEEEIEKCLKELF